MSGKYPGGFVTAGAPAGYSVYFDGTGDWLTVPNNAALELNGVAFCIEAWVYLTSVSTSQLIIGKRDTSGGTSYAMSYYLQNTAGGVFAFGSYGSGGTNNISITSASGVLKAGAWNHVAVTGDGTNIALYANGVRVSTPTAATLNTSTSLVYLGNFPVDNPLLTGYISNARIVKGSQIYSGTTYNLPTQLLSVSGTSLLTCQSPTIIDNSTNAFTVTANGNAAPSTFTPFVGYTAGASGFQPALGAAAPGVWTLEEATYYQGNRLWPIYDPNFNQTTLMLHGNSPTNLPTWITDASTNNFALTVFADAKASSQTPFSISSYPTSGSAYFDGTGDYLLTPSNAAFNPSGSDITVDFFVYLTRYAVTNNIIFEVGTSAVGDMQCNITNTGAVRFTVGGSTGSTISGFTLNTWHYVSCVKSGTNFTVYLNGTAGTTVSLTANSKTQMYIGAQSGGNNIDGYISNFRFVKGSANVPSGVPTAPLTAVANTSLLTLQNAQPTANSSFTDSSTNNFQITRAGNTTQGTFTPFSQTGWSNFFNGSSNLSAASGPTLSADFTLEAFVYITTLNANNMVFGTSSSDNYFGVNTAGLAADFGANPIRWNFTWQTNTWYHIAISRASNTVRAFVNGAQLTLTSGTATDSSTYFSGNILVGRYRFSSALYFTGYISNARVVSGGAIYTGSYTVPTSNLGTTVSAGTVALLTCQSNRFVDNSASPLVVTVANGTPSVQAFSPFAPTAAYDSAVVGGSGYFDGSGDYLTVADNTNLRPPNGDFTYEIWWYPTSLSGIQGIFTKGNGVQIYLASGVMNCSLSSNNTTTYFINSGFGATAPILNAWNHIAVVRSGNSYYGYLNGNRTLLGTSTSFPGTGTNAVGIGAYDSAQYFTSGYLSGARYTTGALYTASPATIPTSPPTTTVSAGTCQLLTNFTNAGIFDATAKNNLETVGNAQISTVQSKYGGSSMVFNGTNSYLKIPSNVQLAFGTGNFTIEFWAYFNVVNAAQTIVDFRPDATGTSLSPYMELTSSGTIIYFLSGGTQITTSALSASTWYHVALVRNGANNIIYINGTQSGSTFSNSSSLLQSGITIGFNRNNAGSSFQYLNGYIDDFRITNGIARYTAPFTPPTSQLQSQ